MKQEANAVAVENTKSPLSIPVETDGMSQIRCPLCGSPRLSYLGALIVQHTLVEVDHTHPVEINIDAYDGDVKVKGISKEDAVDDTSRVGLKFHCRNCNGAKPYILAIEEDVEGLYASMQWLNLEYVCEEGK